MYSQSDPECIFHKLLHMKKCVFMASPNVGLYCQISSHYSRTIVFIVYIVEVLNSYILFIGRNYLEI